MKKTGPSLDWCIVRLGENENWWVDSISDQENWDVDDLGIIDPKQFLHISELRRPFCHVSILELWKTPSF